MRTFSKQPWVALLATAVLACLAGCKHAANDDALARDVQAKVASDPITRDAAVSVTSQDGKVTIRGAVKDAATQKRIEQIAHDEPGTAGVDDQTAIMPTPGLAPTSEQAGVPQQAEPAPAPEAPKPEPVVVPAGTSLVVTVDQALSSKSSKEGQTFLATLAQPVSLQGQTAIPKGSSLTGTVLVAKEKGKIKGEGQLSITLTSITVHGQNYAIQTTPLDSTVKGKGKRTAVTTGGGAAGGALIGGIAGGGKGAGIGALVGAGAGFVGGALTGNKQIEIPAETPLTFALSKSLTLPPR
jgi:hypothetical protein